MQSHFRAISSLVLATGILSGCMKTEVWQFSLGFDEVSTTCNTVMKSDSVSSNCKTEISKHTDDGRQIYSSSCKHADLQKFKGQSFCPNPKTTDSEISSDYVFPDSLRLSGMMSIRNRAEIKLSEEEIKSLIESKEKFSLHISHATGGVDLLGRPMEKYRIDYTSSEDTISCLILHTIYGSALNEELLDSYMVEIDTIKLSAHLPKPKSDKQIGIQSVYCDVPSILKDLLVVQ